MTGLLRAAALVTMLAAAGCATPDATATRIISTAGTERRPLDLGWERLFSVTWDAAHAPERSVVHGYVHNTSPYDVTGLRVLVDGLDADGRVAAQHIGWLPGELRGGGRLYFDVPVTPAAGYRVRVFSYSRIEAAGGFN